MTLILAAVAAPYALVVSDRRLTAGSRREDEYNKMTAVFTADAKVVIAFTGLARAGGIDMSALISDTLVHHADPGRAIVPMRDRLVGVLEARLRSLRVKRSDKRLSLIFAGYRYEDEKDEDYVSIPAVLWRVSNFEYDDVIEADAADSFWIEEAPPREPTTDKPYLFITAGTTKGLAPEQVQKLELLIHERRPPRAAATKALEIGLEAARSAKSKGAIGTSWTSAVVGMLPHEPIWVQYHSAVPGSEIFSPNFVDASAGPQPVIALNNMLVETTAPHSFGFPGTSRNAPCPCGSGEKYKKCHGQPAAARGGGFLNRLSPLPGEEQ